MDNKCEELLADSVINNRYPNKAKQIIRYSLIPQHYNLTLFISS